jgi:uncharacterized damage-inducible protein DinB
MNTLNDRLLVKFRELEKLREKFLSIIDSVDDKTLLLKPAAGKWSILQIVFHLVKVERLSIISIQNNLKKSSHIGKTGMVAKLRAGLLILAMKSAFKFKAPELLRKVPETYDFNELKDKWIKARSDMKKILENISPEDAKKNLFEHPYGGNMGIDGALAFIKEHFLHHQKQVEKIIKLKKVRH